MARNLQEIGKELSYNIDYNTETIIKKATLAHNPEHRLQQCIELFLTSQKIDKQDSKHHMTFSTI
ncbi:MAG: hypothetical protein K0B07_03240 [DPANN group archaeon]|nr:hypothetical protein [DPANN group archaeon]